MDEKTNKMGVVPMKKLIWQMGLPMIISMILQAVYNIVDTAFVINMGEAGINGNLALTYAFPIQLLIIAIGVGTGVGINSLLAKSLGEGNKEKVNKIVGNGIFLGIVIYAVFLIFGLFGSRWFISMQAGGNEEVVEMGTTYLTICCCLSVGAIGYAIYERFLQSTGRTMFSTIAQITGALLNIILDYIFIYPLGMGVAGAAWATVIGQIGSLVLAMTFHYLKNKEMDKSLKYLKPSAKIIGEIYKIGISAAIMQGLLSVMMLCMNLILGTAKTNTELLQGSYGIYYKIMQFALFAAFGISNTIISILSFNYGMRDKNRVKQCIKSGITDSFIIALIITLLFECFATPLAKLFGMASGSGDEMTSTVVSAIRIASLGYVFMGVSVAIQGVLQAFRLAVRPLIISMLRLIIFVLPVAYLFTLSDNALSIVWWTFPIAEVLTMVISLGILAAVCKKIVVPMEEAGVSKSDYVTITISREHGSNGKYIGKLVAQKLGYDYVDKEVVAETAKSLGLAEEYLKESAESVRSFNSIYLSTAANQEAIVKQAEVIRKIATQANNVIIGRGADYVLGGYEKVIKIFIFASEEYKIKTIGKLYGDDEKLAREQMLRSDKARSTYYNFISGLNWGDKNNYDLCVDSSVGPEETAEVIVQYVKQQLSQPKKAEESLAKVEGGQAQDAKAESGKTGNLAAKNEKVGVENGEAEKTASKSAKAESENVETEKGAAEKLAAESGSAEGGKKAKKTKRA